MKQYELIGCTALGIAVTSFSLMSQPVWGANLTSVTLEEAENWTPHLWQIYLRGGGITTWEASVRPHPNIRNSQPGDPQVDFRWPAWVGLPWALKLDGAELTFSIGEEQLIVSQIDGKDKVRDHLIFDGLKLWASATTLDGRVSAGTETFVTVEEVNDMAVQNVSCSAIASTLGVEQPCQTAYVSDQDIVSLKGMAGMLWKDGLNLHFSNPQSHLQIFIEAFDQRVDANSFSPAKPVIVSEVPKPTSFSPAKPVIAPEVPESTSLSSVEPVIVPKVPESTSLCGLLALSTLGVASTLKRQLKALR